MEQITCSIWTVSVEAGMEQLALLLSSDDSDRYHEMLEFWNSWFSEVITGEKVTVAATTRNGQIVGVVRFWCSPYCDHKWLVEGLEVHSDYRRCGIGTELILTGIDHLRRRGSCQSTRTYTALTLHPSGCIRRWGSPIHQTGI